MSTVTRAAVWMLGAVLSFSTMAIAGRAVSVQLDTFELMFYRSCVGLVVVLGFLTLTRRWNRVSAADYKLHLIRNAAHFTGQNLWFFAIALIPLAQVFALEFTSPLWVTAMAPLLLGERLTRMRILSAGIGFAGILIIANPQIGGQAWSPGFLAAALSAIAFALTAIFTRKLTRQNSTVCILLWLTATQLVFGLICSAWDGQMAVPDAKAGIWVAVIGLAGLLAHTCLTEALSLAPASIVMPVDFVRLPLIALVGAVFYDEPVGWAFVFGAALIIVGNFINLRQTASKV